MTLFSKCIPGILFTLCSFCLNDRAYSSLSTMCSLIRLVWTPWILTMSSYLLLVPSPSSPFPFSAARSFYSSYYLLTSISLFFFVSPPSFLPAFHCPSPLFNGERKHTLSYYTTPSHTSVIAKLLPYLLTYLLTYPFRSSL